MWLWIAAAIACGVIGAVWFRGRRWRRQLRRQGTVTERWIREHEYSKDGDPR